MSKIKLGFFMLFIVVLQSQLLAQNSIYSPYSRYGYGQLSDQAFGGQRGMGGIGYGLRDSKMINPLNPASFSSIDSMTFMLDVGVTGQSGWYKDPVSNGEAQKFNGNLEYVAMQFPLYRSLGMGIGFKPVSNVGYEYGDQTRVNSETTATRIFSGSGGINQLYGVLSYDFFNRFSLGVNVAYLFGDIYHNRQVSFNTTDSYSQRINDTIRMSGLTYEFGLQYTHQLGKGQNLVVGAVYSPKIPTTGNVMSASIINSSDPVYKTVEDVGFNIPETFGVGFTYNKVNKLTVGGDFQYQKWADTEFFGKTDTLSNRMKINAGGEFTPDFRSRNYFSRVRYRIGGYYSNSYVKVQGSGYNEYGASLGLGLPMPGERSFLNLAFEYSMLKPEVPTLIDEKHFKITISYTFNELWFHKRKVQ